MLLLVCCNYIIDTEWKGLNIVIKCTFMIDNRLDFKFVSDRIAKEVEQKIIRLHGQNEACFVKSFLHRRLEKALRHEANIHSFKIENPNMLSNGYNTHAHKKDMKKGLKSLERAFSWALNHYKLDNLSEDYLRGIVAIIEPMILSEGDIAKYRSGMVRAGNSNFTPPYPEKLPSEMKEYIHDLTAILSEKTIHSALEGASFAHLHLTRIHPFDDGNGRTSRTLQNVILVSAGLPPAVIYPGEKEDYFTHLDRAHLAWRGRTSGSSATFSDAGAEREFYNYIAGKVSVSLDRILS